MLIGSTLRSFSSSLIVALFGIKPETLRNFVDTGFTFSGVKGIPLPFELPE
jgi:hypothetical protein